MTGDATDLDDLQRKCTDFAAAFPDAVDSARLVEEIQDCRILFSRRARVDVAFPNLKVGLQILLTVSISVAGFRLRTFNL